MKQNLDSANDDMLSMNDELHSINNELAAVNAELKARLDQLTIANADLENFFASSQLAVIVVDHDLALRSFTDAAICIFPLAERDRGRALSEVATTLEDRRYLEHVRAAADAGTVFEGRIRSADGERDYAMRVVPYRRLDGSIDGATLVLADITTALGLERALDEERERLELAVGVAGVGVWEFDARRGLFTVDSAEMGLLGLDGGGPLSEDEVFARVHEADRMRVRAAQQAALDGLGGYDETFRVVGRDGQTRWLHSVGRAHRSGLAPRLLGVSFDCTAEREDMASRELLLREMDHRVKNLFAVVGAMVAVSAREADDVPELAANLCGRIAAMGRAHALTQQFTIERPLDLAELVDTVIAPTRSNQQVTIAGPKLTIPIKLVTPLALIFHEWATNAAKYGALANRGGVLEVRWARLGDTTRIDWTERGIGGLDTDSLAKNGNEDGKESGSGGGRPGFGTRLIEATVSQLGATLGGSRTGDVLHRSLELGGLGEACAT